MHPALIPMVALPVMLAQSPACPPIQAPTVRVTLQVESIRHNFSEPISRLTQAGQRAGIQLSSRHAVGGLTRARHEYSWQTQIARATLRGSGRACAALSSVRLHMRVVPDVFIASDFERGSCEFQATYEHEMKHVAVSVSAARYWAPRIEAELNRRLSGARPVGPLPVSELGSREIQFRRFLEATLEEINRPMTRDIERRNAAVDTPEEYARVAAQCAGTRRGLRPAR